jgi:hypothetical protein
MKRMLLVFLILVVTQSYKRQAEAIPILIDNSGGGGSQTFGPDKFGQTITVPVGAVSFKSISFFLGPTTTAFDITSHFTVHIYLWDDAERHVVGSSLFDSTLQTVGPNTIETPSLTHKEYVFSNLAIPVMAGEQYMVFIDQVEFNGVRTRVTAPDTYDGGQYWSTNGDITNTWGLDGDGAERNADGANMGFIAEFEATDSDNDGIPDNEDACHESDLRAIVIIGECDSGVTNTLFATGCTISDLIAACAEGASNHGQFVSCVADLTNDLKKAGTITGRQKDAIESCAAKAHIP